MTDFGVAELGASKVHPDTRLPIVQAKVPTTQEENDSESLGDVAQFGALGVTALPAPKDANGHCEALFARDLAGLDAVLLAMRDERVASIVAELKDGETCLHATKLEYGSRVFCKDGIVALIVGDNTAVIVDRNTGTITAAAGGAALQLGRDGFLGSNADGHAIELKDGIAKLMAPLVFLGNGSVFAPVLVAHPTSGSPIPSTTVFAPDPTDPTNQL